MDHTAMGGNGSKNSESTQSTVVPTNSRRLLQKIEEEYKHLECKLQTIEEEYKQLDCEVQKLEEQLEEKRRERSRLQSTYDRTSEEFDRKKGELRYARRELSGATRMQAIGHQVVGGKNRSHGDVKMMYEVFFGRKAVHVKGKLKGQLGSVETKQILSHIFQVIYHNIQGMLVNLLLESPLILHEVPQLQEIRDIVRETKHREDRKQILQAFQIPSLEGMTNEQRAEVIKCALAPLFEVASTCSVDADSQVEIMRAKQMAYGILLQSCGLMSEDTTEKHIPGMTNEVVSRLSEVAGFGHAKSIAGELLDAHITDGVRLSWMMVTRIPPMIAVTPIAFDPHCTTLEDCGDGDPASGVISVRPILFFSYEGQVAVEGIVTTPPLNSGPARQNNPENQAHKFGDEVSSGGNVTNSTLNISSEGQKVMDDDSCRATAVGPSQFYTRPPMNGYEPAPQEFPHNTSDTRPPAPGQPVPYPTFATQFTNESTV